MEFVCCLRGQVGLGVTKHSEFALAFLFNFYFLLNSLLPFAKYLELLIYLTAIHSSSICEHTTSQSPSESDPLGTCFRSNFLRHFSTDTCKTTFSLAEERDIFQLHFEFTERRIVSAIPCAWINVRRKRSGPCSAVRSGLTRKLSRIILIT